MVVTHLRGAVLSQPDDIVLSLGIIDRWTRENAQAALESLFGRNFVDKMTPTPMLGRLARMKAEVDRGHESFERKLRYLFWLN